MIKRRLLRVLQGAGVALHEIEPAVLVHPKDGPLAGDRYDSDLLVPAYWLSEEIGPSVEDAIAPSSACPRGRARGGLDRNG